MTGLFIEFAYGEIRSIKSNEKTISELTGYTEKGQHIVKV